MRKQWPAYCMILIELVIQIYGGIYYDRTPDLVWALANAILILMPLAFGIGPALLCFLPVFVSEVVWYFKLSAIGPLLHVASFALSILVLGWANGRLKDVRNPFRVTVSGILYELGLLGEETLYHSLIRLFLHRSVTWAKVSGTFLSPANPLLLILLVLCCRDGGTPGSGDQPWDGDA